MLLAELFDFLVSKATCVPGHTYYSSAFHPIAAAFGTLGYYAQSDFIYLITDTGFKHWAPLLYMCSAIAGFIGLAIGAPPRNYMWFFLGPGIYHWLLGTPVESYGMEWRMTGDSTVVLSQAPVYKHLEAGLINSMFYKRQGGTGGGGMGVSAQSGPDKPASVSKMFAWYDSVLTETVLGLTDVIGVGRMRDNPAGGQDTNIPTEPDGGGTSEDIAVRFNIMASVKWTMLENVTGARLKNGNTRDLLVTFLSSECGDLLAKVIDETAFASAGSVRSSQYLLQAATPTCRLPTTVFVQESGSAATADCTGKLERNYNAVISELAVGRVPTPRSARNLFGNASRGSFGCFYNQDDPCDGPGNPSSCKPGDDYLKFLLETDSVSCGTLLDLIINGFRWEAGHVFYQMMAEAPGRLTKEQVLYSLYYGWGLRKERDGELLGTDNGELEQFTKDLIFIYMLRNELAIAPKISDKRYAGVRESVESQSVTAQSTTGARSRYAEIYSWAMLIPYVQGTLLYLLAMGYPFACIVMLVPGWHKTLFTWMTFWAWVKLWDVGFAIVTSLERAIWAMMGNNSAAADLAPWIHHMSTFGTVGISKCDLGTLGTSGEPGTPMACLDAVDPSKCPPVSCVWSGLPNLSTYEGGTFSQLLKIFDRALVVGPSLDFEQYNAYYLYIMVAMYMAVPAICGQLVLGAKAGVASMIGNFTQNATGDAARGASSAFSGQINAAASANSATVDQESKAKAFRGSGLAAQAIEAGNKQAAEQLASSVYGARNQGLSSIAQMNQLGQQNASANLQAGMAMFKLPDAFSAGTGASIGGMIRRIGGALGPAAASAGAAALGHDPLKRDLPLPADGGGSSPGAPISGGSTISGAVSSVSGGSVGAGGASPGRASGLGVNTVPAAQPGRSMSPGSGGATNLEQAAGFIGGAAAAAAIRLAIPGTEFQDQQRRGMVYDAISQLGSNAIQRGFNDNAAAINSRQADNNVAQFGAGAYSQGYGNQQQRAGAHANYDSEMRGWEASRNFANQVSSNLAAMGGDAGRVAPGRKPSDMMGMAMDGMLGGSMRSSANYFNPAQTGGFFSQVSGNAQSLSQAYGSGAISSAYNQLQGTPATEVGRALVSGSTMLQNAGTALEKHEAGEAAQKR